MAKDTFRHAAASNHYEMTRHIELVKRFLGHRRISKTSDIHVHPDADVTEEATQAGADVFLGGAQAKGCAMTKGRDLMN